jgi:hypothetical protein
VIATEQPTGACRGASGGQRAAAAAAQSAAGYLKYGDRELLRQDIAYPPPRPARTPGRRGTDVYRLSLLSATSWEE